MSRAALIGSEESWASGHPPSTRCGRNDCVIPGRCCTPTKRLMAHTPKLCHPDHPRSRNWRWCIPRLTSMRCAASARAISWCSRPDLALAPGDNPVFSGMWESEGLKVGAALVGAELLLNGEVDVAFSFTGGLHHAGPNFRLRILCVWRWRSRHSPHARRRLAGSLHRHRRAPRRRRTERFL